MGFKTDLAKAILGKEYVIEKAVAVQRSEEAINAYVQNVYQWLFNFQPIIVDDKPIEYVNSYKGNSDVYTCIDKIAKKLVKTPIIIYEVNPGKEAKYLQYKSLRSSGEVEAQRKATLFKSQSLTEVNQKDIERIIETPNSEQTRTEFFQQLVGFFLISGNGYVYFNGPSPGIAPWTEMFVLPSQLMEIISGGIFEPIKGYRLLYSYLANDLVVPFDAKQVEHIKTFNPEFNANASQLYGMSPLRSLLTTLAMSKEGRNELVKQAKNGGTLGMLSPDGTNLFLNDTQQEDLQKKLQAIRASNRTGERMFPSAGPLKYTQIGLPSTDLQLIEVLGVTRDDIYRAYHVPLTYANQEATTYDNASLMGKQFIYDAVMPIGDIIEDRILNKAICGPVNKKTGKKYVAHFDYQSLPELQADMEKLATWLNNSPDLTLNEKREAKGYGKSTEPGTDQIFIPSGWRALKDAIVTDDSFTDAQEE